jgi:ceramide glucosyltransferase
VRFWYPRASVLAAFYILVLAQIVVGFCSVWQGYNWLRMVRRRLRRHPGFFAPRVAVICPCKGAEPGLEENLTALTRFDYSEYEIFFSLASETDPARAIIERIAPESPRKVHVVIAGQPVDCGEKVNNLREAVERLGEGFETIVFTDSDVRAGRRWLGGLVACLADPQVGAATTFRWYFPQTGGFASALASAWNAAIVTVLGEHSRNFCWGGGTAIRRQTFEQARVLDYWRGALSDDYALTRALRDAGRPISFVPECVAPTFLDTTWAGLVEFTDRQIIITRVYSPRLWAAGALVHLFYCAALLYAFGLILTRGFAGETWLSLALLALLVPLLAAVKGGLRTVAVLELLPEWKSTIHRWGWTWSGLAPLVPFLYLRNALVAAFRRRIRWRGVSYELVSPNQTRILSR